MRSHGAQRIVDYTQTNFAEEFKEEKERFDVVYDTSSGSTRGEDYHEACMSVLKPEGQYVFINGSLGRCRSSQPHSPPPLHHP